MTAIVLINMPFASTCRPSLGLTQLKSVLNGKGASSPRCRLLYLNHDFAALLGVHTYENIAEDIRHHQTGLGDWFFRQIAFPDIADNTSQYMGRFYFQKDESTHRFKSAVLDARWKLGGFLQDLISKYDILGADIVGFTSMFQQNVASFAMAKLLKAARRDLVTVMGGANCEAPMGEVIANQCDFIDYVVSGSGLVSFPKLVKCVESGARDEAASIPGVLSRANPVSESPEGRPVCPSPASRLPGEELDINTEIPLEYEEFLDSLKTKFPEENLRPAITFETSRGCWWGAKCQCTFCGLNGTGLRYRFMDPALAVRQFEAIFGYADRCSEYVCVDNVMPKSYVGEVFPKLTVPKGISITYEVRPTLTLDELRTLSQSQVKVIQPGIESLATSTLKLMRKGSTAFQNIRLLRNCLLARIRPIWNLLVGFPGEQEDVYRRYVQFLPLLFHMPPPSGCHPVRFDRYSLYFNQMKDYGLELQPLDYYELIYPWPRHQLFDLAYYFADRNMGRSQYFNAVIGYLGPIKAHVEKWQKGWTNGNGGAPPQLVVDTDRSPSQVIDTRSGRSLKYSLSPLGVRILQELNTPKGIEALRRELVDVSTGELDAEFSFVVDKGLVFEESEQYVSLTVGPG